MQDVFVKLWNGQAVFNAELGSGFAFLATITRNRALDVARRRGEVSGDEAEMEDVMDLMPSPEAVAADRSDLRALVICLDQLADGPRRAIVAAYVDGASGEEIAARLSAPLGTIKSWIHPRPRRRPGVPRAMTDDNRATGPQRVCGRNRPSHRRRRRARGHSCALPRRPRLQRRGRMPGRCGSRPLLMRCRRCSPRMPCGGASPRRRSTRRASRASSAEHAADEGVVVGLAEALAVRTRHLESRVARWRWATAAASALAAGIALFAILGPRLLGPSPSEDRRYVAVINSTGELPPLVVTSTFRAESCQCSRSP